MYTFSYSNQCRGSSLSDLQIGSNLAADYNRKYLILQGGELFDYSLKK